MSAFADTSIVCALTSLQDRTAHAYSLVAHFRESIQLSALVVFEFRQSVRLQAFRFSKDRSQGFSKKIANAMLDQLHRNIIDGAFIIAPVDWMDVYSLADRLSVKHIFEQGHRTLDVLHVATALHLKSKTFLTFDQNQALLAKREGLRVPR